MQNKVMTDIQDLTYLNWSHARNSSGTAGTFLKSQSISDGKKIYYKLSNFDSEKGIIGHECVNEIIVDRMLTLLGVEHLAYQLIHANIEIDGKILKRGYVRRRILRKEEKQKRLWIIIIRLMPALEFRIMIFAGKMDGSSI